MKLVKSYYYLQQLRLVLLLHEVAWSRAGVVAAGVLLGAPEPLDLRGLEPVVVPGLDLR